MQSNKASNYCVEQRREKIIFIQLIIECWCDDNDVITRHIDTPIYFPYAYKVYVLIYLFIL